jgi:hypothetical protein
LNLPFREVTGKGTLWPIARVYRFHQQPGFK